MLRLTPFEEYMYRDDREGYLMTFFIRLRFSGVLDMDTLRNAYRSVTARHPLLHSVVVRDENGKYYWTEIDREPEFMIVDTDDPDWLPNLSGLDVTRIPGIRLYHVIRNESSCPKNENIVTDLLFQVHHACCDGMGLVQVINDFLHLYNGNLRSKWTEPSSPPDPKTIDRRDKPQRNLLSLLKMFWTVPAQVFGIVKFARTYIRKPTPLVPMTVEEQQQRPPGNIFSAAHRIYDVSLFLELKDRAKRIGVTLNDLLARNLFLVLNQFRNQYYPENEGKKIRLAVPVNLRCFGRGNGHVANVVSLVFMDRNPNETNSETFLKSIHREMAISKRFHGCLTFGYMLRFCRMIPGLMAAEMRRKRKVWASCVFSNLGPIFQTTDLPKREGRILCGDAVLRNIVFLPPIRAWTAVSIGMTTYDGNMTIGLHYDSRFLSRNQAEELQDMLHEQFLREDSPETQR